jgi:phosphate-selective porin
MRQYILFVICLTAAGWTRGEEQTVISPEAEEATAEADEEAPVAALLDESSTKDLHDDTTILRDVVALDDEAIVLFDALRLWIGGAAQYDYFNFDGIYNHQEDGERDEGGNIRRLEGIVRARLFDRGELKLQYDFDSGIVRDAYYRFVSTRPNTPVTITVGHQKEPIGLDNLYGNKFGMAQERSSPSSVFGNWRSMGVRLHKAFQLDAEQRRLDIFEDDSSFMTTSIGVFSSDLDDRHDTDIALTGRFTGGIMRGDSGAHLGFAASYREGEFDQIRLRPEVQAANKITLAEPCANTQGIVSVEGALTEGRFYLQSEAFYSEYRGRVDGYGGGAYLQASWFLTTDRREYNPRWGTLAPHKPSGRYSVEVFSRISHTRGDDDLTGWNDFNSLTIGASYFQRKFRASINLLYGESREPITNDDEGVALNIRLRYLL